SELYRSPRDLMPSVPKELSDVVTRAMAFDPKQRFATTKDMAEAIAGDAPESLGFPHLVVLGKKCKVKKEMEIGRDHKACDQGCTKRGVGHPPDIGILDTERYLSKHHARILKDPKGRCWVEDLGSLNGTAMSHDGGRTYQRLPKVKRQPLTDALAPADERDRHPARDLSRPAPSRDRSCQSGHHRGGPTASGMRRDGDDPEPCGRRWSHPACRQRRRLARIHRQCARDLPGDPG